MPAAEVTIVVPVRDAAPTLPRLLRSLEAVDWPALRVLLVDNGSRDASPRLCRDWAARAPMPARLLSQPRPGAPAARNLGLSRARTEWVYFFDADDELSPSFLARLMPRAPGHDMLAFPTRVMLRGRPRRRAFPARPTLAWQILAAPLSTQSVVWRAGFLRSIGGWDESLGVWQDWELGARALARGPRLLWAPGTAYHTIHPQPRGITATATPQARLAALATAEPLAAQAPQARRPLLLRRAILQGQGALPPETRGTAPGEAPPAQAPAPAPPPAPPPAARRERALAQALRLWARAGLPGAWRLALAACPPAPAERAGQGLTLL